MTPPDPISIPNALTLQLTPRGHLLLMEDADTPPLSFELQEGLTEAFADGSGHGLFYLGATQVGTVLTPVLAWWRDFAAQFVTAVCAHGDSATVSIAAPDPLVLETMACDLPPMQGAEYVTAQVLATLWSDLSVAMNKLRAATQQPLADFLKTCHPAWNLVGRVYFNLAENRKDEEAPFAFLATYTSRLSAHGKAQHLPLSKALAEFSVGNSQAQLLSLLKPVQAAAAQCEWLRTMVQRGEIYHPLRWTPQDAYQLLQDVPQLESAGILVRAPSGWGSRRPSRPVVKASVGERRPSLLGVNALLDFSMAVTLDGDTLTAEELQNLLHGSDGLQMIRGRWVEVDKGKLQRMMARFEGIDLAAHEGGVSFSEAMRLMAGASLEDDVEALDANWSELVAGPWLAETLKGLRQPGSLARLNVGTQLHATLRPYQEEGVRWLYLLTQLKLGACLADDMGLGKTIQVLALLLLLKQERNPRPSLLVAPASLLANWLQEAERFAPGLRVLTVHPSVMMAADMRNLEMTQLAEADLVITSYGTLLRWPVLLEMHWQLAVIDEAQAIKNPGAKQTRQVKRLQADSRIALTGTPVENRLSDLWSIFDFTHPGLLGSDKVFGSFTKRLAKTQHFGPLRNLVRPYILRRLKTDKKVINDLPDKTEIKAWCHLSQAQAALYQGAVEDLTTALREAEGMERRGVVLSFLMRFKQICNHPSQWLGDSAWGAEDSGKFIRLRELVEVIAARQEKVLVFTQFRETTEPLAAFLGNIFGRDGLILHGGTPVAKRRDLVKRFQDDELTPFFVLSLKAGGAGLNLTAASHVIHFDRWWNPAVENQATDRAFRIGQKKNVLVHKFVCRGTIEDRIDALIESKQQLVKDVLEGGAELRLTELSDRELLNLVKLDIHTAQES